MGYGVFVYRSDSIYDDNPAESYQFSSAVYLGRVRSCVGDWITYYEPRKAAETRGYDGRHRVRRGFTRRPDDVRLFPNSVGGRTPRSFGDRQARRLRLELIAILKNVRKPALLPAGLVHGTAGAPSAWSRAVMQCCRTNWLPSGSCRRGETELAGSAAVTRP